MHSHDDARPSSVPTGGVMHAQLAPQRYDVRWRDVAYRRDDARAWLARVYEPQGRGPFPAVLEVHGGAWTSGDRTDNAARDEALAAGGIVVVAIDFRLGTEAPYPASIADANFATRWLKRHTADFNAIPDAVGGLGFSSGGHM
jgi:acetyl esterase